MKTQTIDTARMEWRPNADFPGAAKVKVLRNEGARQERTVLVRLPPKGRTSPHTHMGTVQHYVVDGEYELAGEIFGVGAYRHFDEHADVPEISTERGVTILMIYDPVS